MAPGGEVLDRVDDHPPVLRLHARRRRPPHAVHADRRGVGRGSTGRAHRPVECAAAARPPAPGCRDPPPAHRGRSRRGAERGDDYVPPTFAADGFIHCTAGDDLMLQVANRFYASAGRAVGGVDDRRGAGASRVRWEPADAGEPTELRRPALPPHLRATRARRGRWAHGGDGARARRRRRRGSSVTSRCEPRRARARQLRAPHQNRSRPSTSTTSTPGALGARRRRDVHRTGRARSAAARDRDAGRRPPPTSPTDSARGTGEHVAHADGGEHRRPVRVGVERHPRPAPDRHERRAARAARRHPSSGSAGRSTHTPSASTERQQGRHDVGERTDRVEWTCTPAATNSSASSRRFSSSSMTTRSGVRPTMACDVGILRPADVTERRLLTEPRAGERLDAPGEEGLGDRRDETDDAHPPDRRRGHAPSSLRFCASNSSCESEPRYSMPSSFSSCEATSTAGGGSGVPPWWPP